MGNGNEKCRSKVVFYKPIYHTCYEPIHPSLFLFPPLYLLSQYYLCLGDDCNNSFEPSDAPSGIGATINELRNASGGCQSAVTGMSRCENCSREPGHASTGRQS